MLLNDMSTFYKIISCRPSEPIQKTPAYNHTFSRLSAFDKLVVIVGDSSFLSLHPQQDDPRININDIYRSLMQSDKPDAMKYAGYQLLHRYVFSQFKRVHNEGLSPTSFMNIMCSLPELTKTIIQNQPDISGVRLDINFFKIRIACGIFQDFLSSLHGPAEDHTRNMRCDNLATRIRYSFGLHSSFHKLVTQKRTTTFALQLTSTSHLKHQLTQTVEKLDIDLNSTRNSGKLRHIYLDRVQQLTKELLARAGTREELLFEDRLRRMLIVVENLRETLAQTPPHVPETAYKHLKELKDLSLVFYKTPVLVEKLKHEFDKTLPILLTVNANEDEATVASIPINDVRATLYPLQPFTSALAEKGTEGSPFQHIQMLTAAIINFDQTTHNGLTHLNRGRATPFRQAHLPLSGVYYTVFNNLYRTLGDQIYELSPMTAAQA